MKKFGRSVGDAKNELSITGSKDAFVEDINISYSLINNRIIKGLKYKELNIGKYSKTVVRVIYIDSIANLDLVNSIYNKLSDILIDGIVDSSYLKKALEDSINPFPTLGITEKPDKACQALLEGKIVIMVDNSPYVLILPTFFMDFFHSSDDYYQKSFNASFIRIVRLIAFLIAIFLPGLFIAITTRNYDLVPLDLLLMLKAGRSFVPFPAYVEAIIMIISFEILRESDIRMSTTSSSSISILGGLILGDAAVAAGIVSPIMIIIIAISSIAGLIFSSIEFVNTIRIYKLINLLLGSLFGIVGVIISLFIMSYNIIITKSFGYKYFSFKSVQIDDAIIKTNQKTLKRNPYLTHNVVRGRFK